jgi:hypothetical protein
MVLTIVTACSQNHLKSLIQFLISTSNIKIPFNCYVYDLGIDKEKFDNIKIAFPKFTYRTFDYSKYPDYFNIKINAGEYAWKPVIIEEVSKESDDILIWFDSGNKIVKPLDKLCKIIMKQDIYSPISSDNVKKWTHPLTLEYIGIDKKSKILEKSNRNGAALGFNLKRKEIRTFIDTYSRVSQDKDCIAPIGSSRLNHRQDQSVFTLLYYQFFGNSKTEGKYIGFTIHNDVD